MEFNIRLLKLVKLVWE